MAIRVAYMQSPIGGGERNDAASAYLYPAVTPPNLDILLDTHTTKLSPISDSQPPDFCIVELAQARGGEYFALRCIKGAN